MSIAAIILAAGRGSRFGPEPKLLAPLDGKPLVRHAVEAAIASRARPVILVTGHRAPEVEAAASGLELKVVRNPHYGEGLSTSLRAGFSALPCDAEGALVLLADMPLVRAEALDRLVEAWRVSGCPAALVPVARGRRSNPVLLSKALAPEIETLTGDIGAAPLLRRLPDVVEWPMDDAALVVDVDTVESLDALRSLSQER
jgi:molybdenum cofactor cytidylyltransferase